MDRDKKDIAKWLHFERRNYIIRYLRYRRNQISEKIFGHEYWPLPYFEAGHRLLSIDATNRIISEAIEKQEPFWVGRWGGTEMNMVYEFLRHDLIPDYDNRVDATNRLCELSGFFPNDVNLGEKFVRAILESSKNIDLQAMWGRYMADYIYHTYQPQAMLTRLDNIEPWNLYLKGSKDIPWTSKLKRKKVLLVHPFSASIAKQYEMNREKIFNRIYDADDILPEFELHIIKAVQTLAGEHNPRFDTWFDALEWMKDEIKKSDFDVAIIGCGAYGYLLADEVKRMGKVAVHLAGATQLLFGITGKRWETEHIYKEFREKVINEYWVRPDKTETIVNGKRVENACYW